MCNPTDIGRLDAIVEMLDEIPHDARLLAMRNLCQNNGGHWDIPSDMKADSEQILVTIHMFGVSAFAFNLDELSRNWLTAARNIVKAAQPLQMGAA